MTETPSGDLDIWGVIRRQWWVVAVCAVVAVAVAFAGAYGKPAKHAATSTVRIDTPAISRTQGIPTPDDLLGASNADLRARIRVAGHFTSAEMAGLRFAGVGSPTTRIQVVASSSDPASAARLAKVSAEQIIAYVRNSAAIEIGNAQQRVKAAAAAIAAMNKRGASPSVFDRWSVEDALITQQGNVTAMSNIYRWDGRVAVATAAKTTGLRSTLAAALLVGLFIGIVLGGVREYLYRRRAEASA